MDLRQLQHFLAVADGGSVADAARQLRLSQPALSVSIQRLERSLGTRLFDRSSEGMKLNEFGRALETRARLITTETARAEHEQRELLNLQRGRIVVGHAAHFTGYILPKAIIRFHEAHPSVGIVAREGGLSTLVGWVKAGIVDFAVSALPVPVTTDPNLGIVAFFSHSRALLVAGAANPIAARHRIRPRELLSCRWLLPAGTDFFRGAIEALFAKWDMAVPEPAAEYDAPSMAKRLVADGPYVAFFSEPVVCEEIDSGLLKEIRVPGFKLEIRSPLGALFRGQAQLAPAAQKMLNIVKDVSRETRR